MSAENTSSTNDVSTAYSVSYPSVSKSQKECSSSNTDEVVYSFFANQSSAPQLDYDDLEKINDDDMKEMDLKWQVAMISMRIKKFHKRTGKKLQFDTKDPVDFDKTKVECFNCHKMRNFARDCIAKGNYDSRRRDDGYNGNKAKDNGSDNEDIFTELARMGYEKPPPKLTFYKAFFSAQWKFLIHTLVQCISAKRTAWNEFSCLMVSDVICLATALEILKLNKRVKKLEKKRRLKSSGLKRRMHPNRGKIAKVDADKDITLVDAETQVDMDAELQRRIYDVSVAATKDVSADEPTVFDDEEVTMTVAQTLIKMKAEKVRLLDEQIAKRLHDEEVEQAAAREKQEKDDLEKAKGLQQQYDEKQENINWNAIAKQIHKKHLDNIRKYQSLKRKLISIAQARKNMIIYLKNMVGYKMDHFRGMTYDKVLTTQETPTNDPKETSEEDVKDMLEIVPIYEFKVEALQVKYPLIHWEIHSEGSRTYWKIIRVGGITEAYQSFKDMLKGFDKEDLDALWRLVKEKFSTAMPTVNKKKALWVELTRLFKPNADDVFWKLQRYIHDPLTWKLYTNCGVHHVSSTKRRDIFMLTEKDYPLSNVVMIMMLSAKLQVEEDKKMARDLVMKIFMEANKPKSRSLDTSSKDMAFCNVKDINQILEKLEKKRKKNQNGLEKSKYFGGETLEKCVPQHHGPRIASFLDTQYTF
nr:ribonuclease H-like domain-containing protein [Tanacetum cinerariifolium]